MNETSALSLHDVSVRLNGKLILRDLNVNIPAGTLCAVIGPNGAGKSTLLKAILGMHPLSHGEILVYGKVAQKSKRRIGYVPQKESVDWDFPISVEDVVLMGTFNRLGLFARPGKRERELAHLCLQKLGINDLRTRQISQLSGGQQQRVFLARALAQQADVYFMDEPFVGVDATTERNIVDLLKNERARGTTIFVVHHDLQTVAEYFDHVIMLNQTVIADGPVHEVFHEDTLRQTYGGSIHFIKSVLNVAGRDGR